MSVQTLPPRGQIAPEHTWNAESAFATPADWQAEFDQIAALLPGLAHFQGHIGDSPDALADWLEMFDLLQARIGKLQVYASMAHEVDATDQAAAARYDRMISLGARAQATGAFSHPEILAIGQAKLSAWAASEPRLTIYSHFFEQLENRRAHIRSAEVEEVLGRLQDPFAAATNTHGILADADLHFAPARSSDGKEYPVAQGTISALLTHTDRELRHSAWESYADAHLALRHTMANCLATGVKQQVLISQIRNYPSALEASLSDSFIPVEVFYNLLETYRRNLPTWHRYWSLRRRALGYKKLHVADTRAALANKPLHVPFRQAVDWICAGMQPLGDAYVEVLRRGVLEERWVDIYPNQGKRMGAFSSGVRGTHPFILMSYNDDIYSMSTLAHELGHSLHSYQSWHTQPQVYSDYSLFVAEVASNFNQAMVRAHLLDSNDDPDFQIALIEEAMANFYRYFFVMPALARFELEIHQRVERGEALTADSLIALMADLFREGYGDEVVMDDERVGITWGQFSTHLYSNFYVYQYATGISGAHALAAKVLSGQPDAAKNYLAFLKSGGSLYPLDALKLAGVDLSSPEPIEQTFQVLSQLLDRLERAIKQRG